MILDGFKFSISFLKDNLIKLLLIVSLPFILELLINFISALSQNIQLGFDQISIIAISQFNVSMYRGFYDT